MTVQELIEKLNTMKRDSKVFMDDSYQYVEVKGLCVHNDPELDDKEVIVLHEYEVEE